jgi:1-pyrroline-5-carboxylate dehydrogenase
MNNAYFYFPEPKNEPVLSYAPGTPEREVLKKQLAVFQKNKLDIPMFIGGEEVRTGKRIELHPPHNLEQTLGYYHKGEKKQVEDAIKAALKAHEQLSATSW